MELGEEWGARYRSKEIGRAVGSYVEQLGAS